MGPPLAVEGETLDLAFHPSRPVLAVAGSSVTLWDTAGATGPQMLATLPDRVAATVFTVGPAQVRFSPDGRLLAVLYEDRTVQLWDVREPAQPVPVGPSLEAEDRDGLNLGVSEMAFSADGKNLVLGYSDGTFQYRDVTRPPILEPVTGPVPDPPLDAGDMLSLDLAPDEPLLAVGLSNESVIIWDVSEVSAPSRIGPPLDAAAAARSGDVTFTPATRLLLTSDGNGDVVVRDVSDPQDPVVLGVPVGSDAVRNADGESGRFDAGTFGISSDGRTAVVGGWSGRVLVIDLGAAVDLRDHAHERACAAAGRGLDPGEWERFLIGFPYRRTCPE
jgi:WD40 repeat protein